MATAGLVVLTQVHTLSPMHTHLSRIDVLQHSSGSAVYVGFDPTADSLHTGNLMTIMALLHFRHAGYQPIAVVRDSTCFLFPPESLDYQVTQIHRQINPQLAN